eukprot:7256152-Ditylum_brightwellii.AAC.2
MTQDGIKSAQVRALEGAENPITYFQVLPKKQKMAEKVTSNLTVEKGAKDDGMKLPVAVKSDCDAGDGGASEGDDSSKPAK